MNELPCIDCITLPICKSIVQNFYDEPYKAISKLIDKCKLLDSYTLEFIKNEDKFESREQYKIYRRKTDLRITEMVKYLGFIPEIKRETNK